MARDSSPYDKDVLDVEFKVLDKGFVRLVDYMGSDDRIVQAARVSYASGTKSYREDSQLIDYLIRNHHTSPLEQVIMTFHIKLPIFTARQFIRHRTGRLNEISGRYSVLKHEAYVPEVDRICKQSNYNKQSSGDPLPPDKALCIKSAIEQDQLKTFDAYQKWIDNGLSREIARINLPLSTYTEWYWQFDLNNLMKFLKLRMDKHAQWEIRQYANVMFNISKKIYPMAMSSFENHILNSVTFSGNQHKALLEILNHPGRYITTKTTNLNKKELKDLLDKLNIKGDVR